MNTEDNRPAELAAAPGSVKWVVRDLTGRLPDKECETKEQAEKWVEHLWQWQPSARPEVIVPRTDTERLDWLERTRTGVGYNVEVKAWGVDFEAPFGRSIREAIDAAMVYSTLNSPDGSEADLSNAPGELPDGEK